MNETERSFLKGYFTSGARPTQVQFWEFIDAAASLAEDNNNNLRLDGSIKIGDHLDPIVTPPIPGTIRYVAGSDQYEGFFGGTNSWQQLGAGGGPAGDPLTIGTARLGTYAGTNAGLINTAVFSHQNRFASNSGNDFALAQGSGGDVYINSGGGNPIVFANNALPVMDITAGVLTIGNAIAPVASTLLRVAGDAEKNTGAGWNVISDVRVKQNITDFEDGLEKIMTIKPVKYEYNGKADTLKDRALIGVIAQDIEKEFPYTINKRMGKLNPEDQEDTELRILNDHALTYVMINAIKELNAKIEALEKKSNKSK